ncbi:MAG TPA: PHP domain-containing protein [bacterium]
MKAVADLHMHTNHSDGTLNPTELAQLAKAQKVDAVALTDHDTVTGIGELVAETNRLGLEALAGVELSAQFHPGTLHILGYGFDPQGSIREKLIQFQKARAERNPQILKKLKEMGMPLTLEEVKSLSKAKGQIGRPHIARAMEAKSYVKNYEEAFDRYLTKGGPAYVPKASWSAKDCIDMIHESGGVAVVAHPVQMKLQGMDLRKKVEELGQMGIDGLEVIHPDHSPEDQAKFTALAEEFGLLTTGGSDFHGDHKPGIQLGQGRPPYLFLERLRDRIKNRRQETGMGTSK